MSHVDTPWTRLASRTARGLLARKGFSYPTLAKKLCAIRVPGSDPDTRRSIDEICLEELGNAAVYVLQQQGGTSQDGLVKAVCRLLGVARTTTEAGARISRALTHGRVQAVVAVADGSVHLRK